MTKKEEQASEKANATTKQSNIKAITKNNPCMYMFDFHNKLFFSFANRRCVCIQCKCLKFVHICEKFNRKKNCQMNDDITIVDFEFHQMERRRKKIVSIITLYLFTNDHCPFRPHSTWI